MQKIIIILSTLVFSFPLHATVGTEFPRETIQAFNGEELQVSVVSLEQANRVFKRLARVRSIPFSYIADSCHIKAQELVDIATMYGFQMAKAVLESRDEHTKIVFSGDDVKWKAHWNYHLAPIVFVRGNDAKNRLYVIDPSLFSSSVTLEHWQNRVLRDMSAEQRLKIQAYYISANTFRPSLKEKSFQELPNYLERRMPSFLMQMSADAQRMGPYLQNCKMSINGVLMRGGLSEEDVEIPVEMPFCSFEE